MSIIYQDHPEPFTGPPPDLSRAKATERWLEHFSNSLILTAISQNPKDRAEKQQAMKELTKADQKMAFWKRHPNFNLAAATMEANKLRHLWANRK